ncbi:TPA: ESPR-type extended signal peptide-containing protein [Escherichia albertii]
MNTIYRVIWNHTLGVYQVCSELTKRMTQSFALTLSGRSELNKKHNRYPQLQQITLIITLGLSSSTLAATTFNGEYTFDENKSYAGYIVGANASGTLNIGTNIVASVSDASSSVIGQGTNGRGTVNVYDGGLWDLVDHRYGADSPLSLNIGQEGNGVLNIESGGLVTAGQVILGKLVSSSGEVNVSGNGSILNTRDMLVGQSGTGELLISDYGLVNSSFSSSIGQSRGSSGVVHIENNGQWIIRGTDGQYLDLVVGDSGEGEFYLSTGGKASVGQIQIGKNNTGNGVINVSGVGTELNTYAIQTGLNGVGTLNISDYGVVNSTKSGAVAFAGNSVGIVNVSNHGHWIIKAENGAYQVLNVGVQGYGTVNIESGGVIDADIVTAGFENTGGGLINTANAGSELNIRGLRLGFGSDAILNISDSAVVNNTGQNTFGNNEYVRGTVNITDNGHLNSTGTGSNILEKANTVTLTHAMLQSNAGNIIHVGAGEKNIGGLAFNGGTLIFDTPVPAYLNANGRIIAETLVAGSGNYSWSGHDQNVSGNGVVKIAMQDPWHDPMAASPNNTLNLLEQDDTHPMLQLIKADNVMGSGGSLQLQAMNEEPIPEDKRLKIAQHGVEVATGHYGFRLTTAPGDGLYVNYGLNKLDIHANKELVLAEREGDRQSAADMSAQIIGEGHLVIDTAGQVSLSNGNNNYSGDTRINKGVLRTDANDALGKTANLSISNLAQLNLNATAQTVRTFSGQSGSLLDFNGGYLTLSEGGISNGMLTGEGNFHVTGNILDIIGANGNLSVTHIIDSGAEISLNNGTGAGRGNIVNEGILRLKGVKNTLSNSLRGRGEVYATAGTDVHLRGDNSNFSGLFNIEDGSAITISEQKQLGTAGVIDHGMLIVMTGQNWQLKNEIIGNGDLEKTGDATLTLTNASAGYSGTTQITAGELTLGATLDSIVKMTSTQINIHNGAVMSGFVATAKNVDVMQGGGNYTYPGQLLAATL